MRELKFEGSNKLPQVYFDPKTGHLEIRGRSITENALNFYQPLLEWLNEYLDNPAEEVVFNAIFEYINSSSIIWLMKVFKKLEKHQKNGKSVKINWFYEDDDIFDAGEDIQAILQVPVNIIKMN